MNEPAEKRRPTQHWERKCWQKMADTNKCFIGCTKKTMKSRLTHIWWDNRLPWHVVLSNVCCKLEHSHWVGTEGKLNFWIPSFGKSLLEFPLSFKWSVQWSVGWWRCYIWQWWICHVFWALENLWSGMFHTSLSHERAKMKMTVCVWNFGLYRSLTDTHLGPSISCQLLIKLIVAIVESLVLL